MNTNFPLLSHVGFAVYVVLVFDSMPTAQPPAVHLAGHLRFPFGWTIMSSENTTAIDMDIMIQEMD